MANITRSSTEYFKGTPGPYEGIVVGHLDPAYMGTLKVEIIKKTSSGNDPERTGQMVEARYLSPFYGVTPQAATTGNSGYENTQKSYGMWMVPPDVGTRVIIMLIEGNISQAFWIGCVQDEYMNFMTPGYAATTQVENLTGVPAEKIAKKIPVGEYNKRREDGTAKNPTKFNKPPHSDIISHLNEQGLIDDDVRGTTSSSARREVPSAVFGISTPGPLDKRTNAPKNPIGPFEAKATQFTSRLGGTSFVMDDGDDKIIRKGPASVTPPEYENIESLSEDETPIGDVTLPANELTRIRTRTGHQILLHNTEDLIYIGNARGTSWIEMTSNGKIDIYAQDSISVHTSNDLNFTADRDINFTSGENVNFMVGKDFRTTAGDSIHNTASLNINNTAGQSISEIAGTNISNYANIDASYQSVRNTVLSAGRDLEVSSGANSTIESGYHTHIISGSSAKLFVKEGDFVFAVANGDVNAETGAINLLAEDVSMDLTKLTLNSKTQINMESNTFALNTKRATEINSDGNYYSLVTGRHQTRAGNGIKLQAEGNDIEIRAQDDIKLWAVEGDFQGCVNSDWLMDVNGKTALTSRGLFDISSTNSDNTEVNSETGFTVNVLDRGGVRIYSGGGMQIKSAGGEDGNGDIVIDSGWDVKFKSANTLGVDAAESIQLKASAGNVQIKGAQTELQPTGDLPAIDSAETPNQPVFIELPDDINYRLAFPFISYVKWHKYDAASLSVIEPFTNTPPLPPVFAVHPTPAIYADRVARIPMHEPWYQHENLDPLKFTPDKTRAGSELPDIYHPQIPDTFATTPVKQEELGEKTESIIFNGDSLIQGDGTEYTWNAGALSPWQEAGFNHGLTIPLCNAVFTVIHSQYGTWDSSRTETMPPDVGDDQARIALAKKRYQSLIRLKDNEVLDLLNAGETSFFTAAYGNLTEYGKAIGNIKTADALNFRGHGPYIGLAGRGIFEKLLTGVRNYTGQQLSQRENPFDLTDIDKNNFLAYYVLKHYQDHGRGMLGNTRIMLFGNEDYDIMHKRDVFIYKEKFKETRTIQNAS